MARKLKKTVVHTPLSPEQIAYKDQLEVLHDLARKADKDYHYALRRCLHVTAYNPKERDSSSWCVICDHDLGHYCPDSPDKSCHYWTEDGMIPLNDGTKAAMPEDHDPDYETDDSCIFCGWPQERK